MKFSFDHNNINVLDLEKSVEFYKEALGFVETRRHHPSDDSFTLVFLGDETTDHKLELTCMKDRTEPYNLGENEFHLAVVADNYDEAYAYHKKMGCICYENKPMGIYFIMDPDGYWTEVIPKK
ncbi:VOC family protein [Clostridium estertheticum]|uniref:VOC family protein n=1 Tax=Clostridium estertheticum TaxID=238834 RepID=UPI001C0AA4DF|nr:VOC family protein [Clostridium estertheticum]MBU3214413.1 VOC family protein [Clostridium estertheticum]MBW9151657.1 VOC family protein [Clostridium estertheticum]MCB2361745.1 VOC family protein [Clostridium estertheticum]WAG56398.1 VOC family protein [Clostridium estertheticum]WLC83216.1 VOC family protein [Clostridium estertheticum]